MLLDFSNNITVYDWKFKYLQNNCQDSQKNGTDERRKKNAIKTNFKTIKGLFEK